MRSKLSIFLVGAFITSALVLLFASCDKDDKDPDTVVGKWYVHKEVETWTYQGDTEKWEWIYDIDLDVDYYGATFYEIGEKTITLYYNESDQSFDEEEISYELNGGKIIAIYTEGTYEQRDTVNFKFEDGMLVLWDKYEDEGGTEEFNIYLKKYSGSIPPASWLEPLPDDIFEPDNTYETATTIAVGETTDFHTTTSGDVDWFKFDAASGKKYLIQVSGYIDGYLRLYDTDGSTLLDYNDDNYVEDVVVSHWGNPALLWDCPSSGTYYFSVKGYDSYDVGYYKVALSLSNLTNQKEKTKSIDSKQKHKGFWLFK